MTTGALLQGGNRQRTYAAAGRARVRTWHTGQIARLTDTSGQRARLQQQWPISVDRAKEDTWRSARSASSRLRVSTSSQRLWLNASVVSSPLCFWYARTPTAARRSAPRSIRRRSETTSWRGSRKYSRADFNRARAGSPRRGSVARRRAIARARRGSARCESERRSIAARSC